MLSCNCTLPYFNPDACKNCSARIQDEMNSNNYDIKDWLEKNDLTLPYDYKGEPSKVKKVTRTIEKYGPDGKLIEKEVITEEEEIIDKYYWKSGPTYYSPDIMVTPSNLSGTCNGNSNDLGFSSAPSGHSSFIPSNISMSCCVN